jgi:hypothetical protein
MAADTVKLNEECVQVSNDISGLTSELTIAQINLPGYQNHACEAASDEQNTAIESKSRSKVI